ncbi:UMP phosphatase [compost metagenome]|jgi:HAD superfamily hydrolase (TIGR01450 family)|uniref:HAD superfamily hydrolase (TIGR01450 family) n=3 Tax=Agrobacterium tumefaciens complex TaxID=1183400 RepID=A0AAP4YL89_AGRTU|nr:MULTISPECIES: TIGR01459 family HAD-type hydrolase [Agrobacterium]MCP2135620.1 HAD superfamily hydrolase (TIGR01450 family) [Rhizobium sp. SLBN-94]TGE82032.1 TIGR01459 family HAD-type hydrolase [Rhizobium sp. SEMIA 439]AYM80197.1 HAD family hydrolase [Agrobacterium tumefaciens]KAA1236167.1 TIGR01459 family HAD-type hydrolase [Agrobacterium tumefaciens]KAB0458701.1 TIGR01459 family HAD-type hydrolase [Agrobacterium tumefaciens]
MAHRILTLGEITDGFDVILSDVWGVLHNGVSAFPDAAVALREARKAGKTVVLITNSPRPAPGVIAQLRVLGVPDEAYDRIITSGDVTRGLIAEGPKKVFLLGPERDMPLLEGLDVECVGEAETESVVCTGFFDDETETPEDYTEMLKGFIARKVPMICANPDLVVERGERIIPCAGAMAAYYEQLGGEVRIAGKPHAPIYEACLAAAREVRGAFAKDRVLAIGDGMPTDVKGAIASGLNLLYISGGIHAAEYTLNGQTDEALLNAYLKGQGAAPGWWMPRLA